MANADISLVTLSNTFDEWRTRTNDVISDRNILRNGSYVKDDGNVLFANGTLRISKASGGTTFTNDNDALISGTLTSSVLVAQNPTGIGLSVTANTQLSGNLNVMQSIYATTGNLFVSNMTASNTVNAGSLVVSGNVIVDTNTLVVDSVLNRIGMGTATPSVNLDIVGVGTEARVFSSSAATKAKLRIRASALDFSYETDDATTTHYLYDNTNGQTAFTYSPGSTGYWAFRTNNSERVRIDGSGNLLVGTTSSSYAGKLTVYSQYAGGGNNIVLADSTTTSALNAPRIGSATDNLTFTTATVERVRISPTGNVGIGTTIPSSNLHVVGTANVTGAMTVGGGLTLTGNTNLDAGTLFVDSVNDRVGISTTTPSYKLHVNGQFYAAGGGIFDLDTEQLVLRTVTNSNKQTIIGYNNTNDYSVLTSIQQGTGYKDLNIAAATTLIKTGTTEVIRFSPSGNVNIGGATAATARLQVNTVATNGALLDGLRLVNAGTGGGTKTQIIFDATSTAYGTIAGGYGASYPEMNFNLPSATPGAYTFAIANVEKVRIHTTGNVGIGVSNPTSTLHVAGGANLTGSLIVGGNANVAGTLNVAGDMALTGNLNFDNGLLYLDAANNLVGIGTTIPTDKLSVIGGNISFGSAGTNRVRLEYDSVNGVARIAANSTGGVTSLSFGTSNAGIYSDKVYIGSTGNTGIGTTSPGEKFHVVGNAAIGTGSSGTNRLSAEYDGSAVARLGVKSTTSTSLALGTSKSGVGYKDNFWIDPTGNVVLGNVALYTATAITAPNSNTTVVYTSDNPTFQIIDTRSDVRQASIRFSTLGADWTLENNNDFVIKNAHPGGTIATGAYISVGRTVNPLVFGTGGTERVRITNTGNVGIGTTTPLSPLHLISQSAVAGGAIVNKINTPIFESAASANSGLEFNTDRTSTTDISFNDQDGAARGRIMYAHSSDALQIHANNSTNFYVNSASRVFIDNTGNFGIATNVPTAKLHVAGNTLFDSDFSSSDALTIRNRSAVDGRSTIKFTADRTTTNSWTMGIDAGGSATKSFQIRDTSASGSPIRFTIDLNGNVGIGATSTSPIAPLDITQTDNTAGAIRAALTSGGSDAGFRLIARNGSGTTTLSEQARFGLEYGGTLTSGFSFQRGTSSGDSRLMIHTGSAEKVRIDESGNVGIATTAPVSRFQVSTTLSVTAGGVVNWGNDSRPSALTNAGLLSWDTTKVIVGAYGTSNLAFVTAGGTERMRVDYTTGYVGINTTAPAYNLDVNGTVNATSLLATSYGILSTAAMNVASLTTAATTTVNLDTFVKTNYRTAKYLIQATSLANVHSCEIIMTHDGTNTYMTEYAMVRNAGSIFNLTSDISVNDVRLRVTPAVTDSTTFKVIRTSLTA